MDLIVQCPGLICLVALCSGPATSARRLSAIMPCPSSCQSTGFVSLAGKASSVSISGAVLFLRSSLVCLPLEFEFRGKSCVFIDLYLVFPTNFRIVFLPYTNTVILLEPYCGTRAVFT